MQPDHAKILEQLHTAFPARPIHAQGAFRDLGAPNLDAQSYMKQIEGRTWEELDRPYLLRCHDALSVLGVPHIAAVLPVYLRSLMEDGAGSPAVYALLHLLTKRGAKQKPGISRTRFGALVGELTPAQCAVIAVVLRAFAVEVEGESLGFAAQAALEDWKTYLPTDAP